MDPFIIPNVEFATTDIPPKYFLRGTKKLSLKITETGIILTGQDIKWDEINKVSVKFFNNNPYIQLQTTSNSIYSFFFENKFYYRKKSPWFGASEFITKEFVKTLEEKNLFTIAKLEANISENTQSTFLHTFWNNFVLVFPVLLILISVSILLIGLFGGPQVRIDFWNLNWFKKLL